MRTRMMPSAEPRVPPKHHRHLPPDPIPPTADLAEAVEPIVPRRQLLLQDGDVLIMREAGGLREGARVVYQLRIRGMGAIPDQRFASFEHAAARGEEVATKAKVRLFDFESQQDPPHLSKDARGRDGSERPGLDLNR
jgi:hypothetical protein